MVAPVAMALIVLVACAAWLFGAQIESQFDSLAILVPKGIRQIAQGLGNDPFSKWLLGHAEDINLTALASQAAAPMGRFLSSALRFIAYVSLSLFAGIYLAVQPDRYREGFLRLAPQARRARLDAVLDLMGGTLRRWIVAQLITMIIVGTMTGIGLWALGIGAPVALGLIAGVFALVPYVGPVLASVPGLLMAATLGPLAMLYTAGSNSTSTSISAPRPERKTSWVPVAAGTRITPRPPARIRTCSFPAYG
jgi:predicted PurR-regulated permease PerM